MRPTRYFAVIALALGACGGGGDSGSGGADLERHLARVVEDKTGTPHVKVECPDAGEVCAVRGPGGLRAQVTRDGKIIQP